MALIPITGLASSIRKPGTYIELALGQGPSTASAGARGALYIMPKTSTGTGTVNTLYQITRESEIETLGGPGSMAHRAIRRHLKAYNGGKVWVILYNATADGSPATATATITFATNASARGIARLTCNGELIDISIAKDTTPTVAGDLAVAAINARTHLPYTASNSSGTVTLTAKIAGASQGTATLGVHRIRAEITAGIGMTVATSGAALGMGTGTAGADGTTTEPSNFATALAVVATQRFYYIGTSLFDATSLASLKTHLSTKGEPVSGLRSKGFFGYTGTLANCTTIANTLNYERIDALWQKNSEDDPASLVGNWVALRQKYEAKDSAYNFDSMGRCFDDAGQSTSAWWFVPKAYATSDRPSFDDINDAITDGITPIVSDDLGSYVEMSVSTRSKNSGGTVDDFRATETHRTSVGDEVADTHYARHTSTYAGFKLRDDRVLANGKADPNQPKLPRVMQPSLYRPFVGKILREFEDAAKLQDVDTSIAGMRVVRDPNNTGRLEVGYDIRVIDHLHQTSVRIAEVSPG